MFAKRAARRVKKKKKENSPGGVCRNYSAKATIVEDYQGGTRVEKRREKKERKKVSRFSGKGDTTITIAWTLQSSWCCVWLNDFDFTASRCYRRFTFPLSRVNYKRNRKNWNIYERWNDFYILTENGFWINEINLLI